MKITREMHGSRSFRRAITASTTVTALLLGLLVAKDRPWGYAAMLALILATLVVAARSFSSGSRRLLRWNLLLLTLLFGCFLFGFDSHPRHVSFRLAQVAIVALYVATMLSTLLNRSRLVRPLVAVIVPFAACGWLFATEAMAIAIVGPLDQTIPRRDEWTGLLPGTADVSSGPIWSGRAEIDSEFGLRYRPNSTLKTLYPDNPRGYFQQPDLRSDIWDLVVAPGSAATVSFPPDSPKMVRVNITKAPRDSATWHILLNEPHLRVQARRSYVLEFRARSDKPRTAWVSVAQTDSPYVAIGLQDSILLSPEWTGFRRPFSATMTDPNARVYFSLGGSDASVEVSDVSLRDLVEERAILPDGLRDPYTVSYRFNALGCRGVDRSSTRAADVRRVLMLGDGFTMGVGVHEHDAFASQVEELLNAGRSATGPPGGHEVINCGITGYGTDEEARFYRSLAAAYQPDVVVVVMGLEDDRAHWEQQQRANRRRRVSRWEQVFTVWGRLKALARMRRSYDYTSSVATLLKLNEEVAASHGQLIVVLARSDFNPRWNELRQTVISGLKGHPIPLLDVRDALITGHRPEELVVHATDGHPNERVHAALASKLAEFIKDHERDASVLGGNQR
jgi:hypothetical protein